MRFADAVAGRETILGFVLAAVTWLIVGVWDWVVVPGDAAAVMANLFARAADRHPHGPTRGEVLARISGLIARATVL